MKFLNEWRTRLRERRHKRVIASMRAELSFLGVNTSDMSDEQLEQRVRAIVEALASFGVSLEEAKAGLMDFSSAHRRIQ